MSFFSPFTFFVFWFLNFYFSAREGKEREGRVVEDKEHISDKIMLSRLLPRVNGSDMSSVFVACKGYGQRHILLVSEPIGK